MGGNKYPKKLVTEPSERKIARKKKSKKKQRERYAFALPCFLWF